MICFPSAGAVWWMATRVVAKGVVEGNVQTFTAPGKVKVEEVFVRSGQWSNKGDPLLRLSARDADAQRRALSARVDQAMLRLELLRRGAQLGDMQISRQLDDRDRIAIELASAAHAVRSAEAQLTLAESELGRMNRLRSDGQATALEHDRAVTGRITAEAQLAQARSYVEGLQRLWGRYEQQFAESPTGEDLSDLVVTLHEAITEEARQRLRDFDRRSGNTVIEAPFAGRVDRVFTAAGTACQQDDPLISIYAPASLHVIAFVGPGDRDKLADGAKVRMYPKGSWTALYGTITQVYSKWSNLPVAIHGRIGEVVPAVTFRVDPEDKLNQGLQPGMILSILIETN